MKVLFTSSVSACLELDGGGAYYAKEAYEILLNGERYGDARDTNVFSLFSLTPDTAYEVEAAGERVAFRTASETACLDARKNGAAADGLTEDTAVLQALIDACPAGGRVTLSEGDYLNYCPKKKKLKKNEKRKKNFLPFFVFWWKNVRFLQYI